VERSEIKAIVENILLAADEPVTSERLAATVINGMPSSDFESILEELKEDYSDRNLQIVEVAEGFLLATRREYSDWIRKFYRSEKTARLSQPALDCLSIIAYKQPITRTEVEEIRGVDSAGVVRTLLEKKIIAPAGRKQVLGRPMMYKTTQKFLEYFGLKDLGDLPTLDDLKEAELLGDQSEGSEQQTRMLFEDPVIDAPEVSEQEVVEATDKIIGDEQVDSSSEEISVAEVSEQEIEEETNEIVGDEEVDSSSEEISVAEVSEQEIEEETNEIVGDEEVDSSSEEISVAEVSEQEVVEATDEIIGDEQVDSSSEEISVSEDSSNDNSES
jgi:segregation and condensation protein B